MPTKTKASQNKKTTHSGVKQNAKTTQKKHTHKNTKVQKSTGRPQNKIKKETNTQSVSKVSTDMVKAVSVNSVMEQQKPVIKTAETVVPVFAPETTEKKDVRSMIIVVLLVLLAALLAICIRLMYIQNEQLKQLNLLKEQNNSVVQVAEKNMYTKNVLPSMNAKKENVVVQQKEVIKEKTNTAKTVDNSNNNTENANKYMEGASEVPAVLEKILASNSFPVLGNPNGKYIIVDFFDYTCQWCKKTNYMLDKYITDGKAPNVRLIVIPTPVMGDQSIVVSAYAMASIKQNKFAEFHQALTQSGMTLSLDNLHKIAESVGLDVDQLNKDVDNIEIFNQLKQNKDLLLQLKAQGIPYLIVNGELHAGALVGENLRLVIEQSNK